MADQTLLFHNPEVFSDLDLAIVKRRMVVQSWMPWTTAIITGSSMGLFDLGIRRAGFCWCRIGAAAILGYLVTGIATPRLNFTNKRYFSQHTADFMDRDYLNAYDKKFAEKALNAAGYGNNALREASHLTKKSMANKAYN